MGTSQEDYIYITFGVIGGVLVTFCQLPSIVRVHKRQQALDISYTCQFILGVGIILSVTYYAYNKSVMAYTTSLSFLPLVYLIGLKFHVDRRNARRVENTCSCAANGVTLEHALLPEDHKPSNMRVDKDVAVDPMRQFHRTGDWHNV